MAISAIEFKNVTKRYDNQNVISELDLTVAVGEFVTILGASGSGKTTTLKMINGLIQPDAGEILINGQPQPEIDLVELRRKMGYVVQQVGLFPHMSIAKNIAIVPELLHWPQDRITARVDELLRVVQLNPATYRNRYPRQLSGGQQQRVGVARALAANPEFVLFDEPFGALDALTRLELQTEIKQLHQRLAKKTFLFVTHDINEALFLGQRVLVMNDGQIEQFATPATIVQQPATDYVRKLLQTVEQNRSLWGELHND